MPLFTYGGFGHKNLVLFTSLLRCVIVCVVMGEKAGRKTVDVATKLDVQWRDGVAECRIIRVARDRS